MSAKPSSTPVTCRKTKRISRGPRKSSIIREWLPIQATKGCSESQKRFGQRFLSDANSSEKRNLKRIMTDAFKDARQRNGPLALRPRSACRCRGLEADPEWKGVGLLKSESPPDKIECGEKNE